MAMTQMMSVSLGRLTVGKALDGLDAEETEPSMAIRPASLPNDRFHGPFGVLHMQTRQSSEISSSLPDHGHEYHAEAGNMASQSNCAPTSRSSPQSAAERTPTLLQYFKSHVVSFSHATRRDTTICPWQNIHAPAAEATYEELRLRSVPAPTDLSLLNSLLASSCFHLASRDTASGAKWAELGEQYKQEARQHLDIAIQEEILSLTQTNYEELLMALLSMTMLEACLPPFLPACEPELISRIADTVCQVQRGRISSLGSRVSHTHTRTAEITQNIAATHASSRLHVPPNHDREYMRLHTAEHLSCAAGLTDELGDGRVEAQAAKLSRGRPEHRVGPAHEHPENCPSGVRGCTSRSDGRLDGIAVSRIIWTAGEPFGSAVADDPAGE